jgi:hypothetical protein
MRLRYFSFCPVVELYLHISRKPFCMEVSVGRNGKSLIIMTIPFTGNTSFSYTAGERELNVYLFTNIRQYNITR